MLAWSTIISNVQGGAGFEDQTRARFVAGRREYYGVAFIGTPSEHIAICKIGAATTESQMDVTRESRVIALHPASDRVRLLRRIRVLHQGLYYDVDELTLDWLLAGKTPGELQLEPIEQ